MSMINVVPILTKNKTNIADGLYITISASVDELPSNANFHAYKSFVEGSGYWNGRDVDDWLQIDFGEVKALSNLKFRKLSGMPFFTNAQLLGSLDGDRFELITDIVSEITENYGDMYVALNKVVKYRYYRFLVVSGSACFGKIIMSVDDEFFVEQTECKHGGANLTYRLPLNTTNGILAKQNDPREGLLGMANDSGNYGDLYVVGKDGRSHLTKSGMKSEVVYDGNLALGQGATNITLENIDISKYKEIILEFGVTEETYGTIATHQTVLHTPEVGKKMYSSSISSGSHYFVSHFTFKPNNQIVFVETYMNGWAGSSVLTKIIGIY